MRFQKKIKLQTKLFITYLLLTLIILLFFSVFFYTYVSRRLIQREMSSLEETVISLSSQIENTLHDIDTVSININYSGLVQKPFDDSFDLNISEENLTALVNLFISINGSDTKADYIYLYDFKGNALQLENYTALTHIAPDSLSWMDTLMQSDNSKLVGTPIYKNAATYADWFVSLYRIYYNQYGRPVGAIETAKRCKSLFNPILSYQKKLYNAAEIYIYNQNGQLMYPYNLEEDGKASIPDYYELAMENSNSLQSDQEIQTENGELLNYAVMSYSGWTYVMVQQQSVVLEPIRNMLHILLIFMSILFALALFVTYSFSKSVVKPIKHLKHIIQRMQIDTLETESVQNYDTSIVELNELYNAFEDMCKKLNTSMNELIKTKQQELKSRKMALQSQINPHFYYNSLSNIIVLAEEERTNEIQQMCRNLTSIMRYITDNTTPNIMMKDEIDYINRYLYCMKVRYQSNLEYLIMIPDEMMEISVPKLILQPLVENAIKYGFTCSPPWKLVIKGSINDDGWRIDVIDPGDGFTPESSEHIKALLKEAEDSAELPQMHIDGLGLVNVFLRWKYFCREQMIFEFGNTAEGHGIVSIGCKTDGKD